MENGGAMAPVLLLLLLLLGSFVVVAQCAGGGRTPHGVEAAAASCYPASRPGDCDPASQSCPRACYPAATTADCSGLGKPAGCYQCGLPGMVDCYYRTADECRKYCVTS